MNVTLLDHGNSLTVELSFEELLTILRKSLPSLRGKVCITEIDVDKKSVEITVNKET